MAEKLGPPFMMRSLAEIENKKKCQSMFNTSAYL